MCMLHDMVRVSLIGTLGDGTEKEVWSEIKDKWNEKEMPKSKIVQ